MLGYRCVHAGAGLITWLIVHNASSSTLSGKRYSLTGVACQAMLIGLDSKTTHMQIAISPLSDWTGVSPLSGLACCKFLLCASKVGLLGRSILRRKVLADVGKALKQRKLFRLVLGGADLTTGKLQNLSEISWVLASFLVGNMQTTWFQTILKFTCGHDQNQNPPNPMNFIDPPIGLAIIQVLLVSTTSTDTGLHKILPKYMVAQ